MTTALLKIQTQESIGKAPLHQLAVNLSFVTAEIADEHYYNNDAIKDIADSLIPNGELTALTTLGKLGVVRKLCDEIELRLMQTAN